MDDSFLASVERNHRILALVLLLLFTHQGVELISLWSPTREERITVGTGLIYLETGDMQGDNPPLLQTFLALPYALGMGQFEIFTNEPPMLARYTNLLLSLLCGVFLYLWALKKTGPLGAVFALTLFCLSPNILAHSVLATIDMGAAFLALLFIAFLENSWQRNGAIYDGLTGLILGFAISSKFSNIALLAILIVSASLKGLRKEVKRARVLRHLVIVLLTAWFVFSLSFGFSGVFTSKGPMRTAPNLRFLSPLLPTRAYISLGETFAFNSKTPPPHIGGYRDKWTSSYYLPIVFLLKSPMGILLLLLLVLGSLKGTYFVEEGLTFTTLPPLIFFSFLWLFDYPNTGYRHLLPILPLLYLVFAHLTKKEFRQGVITGPAILLSFILVISAWWQTRPHHLSYVNTLASFVTAEPFVFTGEDCDWGQNEFLLSKELSGMPPKVLKYVNPYPTTVPLEGIIAINANNYVQMLAPSVPVYDWLGLVRPYKLLGNTWALYVVTEKDLRELAKKLDDKNAQLIILRFLMGRGAFKQVVTLGRMLQKQYFIAHHFLVLAHLGLGNYVSARAECDVIAKNKKESANWELIVDKVADNMLGNGKGTAEEQLARAMNLLYCASNPMYDPLIDKFKKHPLFKNPITPHHKNVELRKVWAIRLFKEGRFPSALAMFDSLKGEYLHRTITDMMLQCRELVELERKKGVEAEAEYAYSKVRFGFGRDGIKELEKLWQENRGNFFVLRYSTMALAIRRGLCTPFKTNESELFDSISETNGRWRDPKQVKTSGGR